MWLGTVERLFDLSRARCHRLREPLGNAVLDDRVPRLATRVAPQADPPATAVERLPARAAPARHPLTRTGVPIRAESAPLPRRRTRSGRSPVEIAPAIVSGLLGPLERAPAQNRPCAADARSHHAGPGASSNPSEMALLDRSTPRRHSRPASESWSAPTADSLKETQLAAGRAPSGVADEPESKQQAWMQQDCCFQSAHYRIARFPRASRRDGVRVSSSRAGVSSMPVEAPAWSTGQRCRRPCRWPRRAGGRGQAGRVAIRVKRTGRRSPDTSSR